MASGDYVYHTAAAPPPLYNEQTPLMGDNCSRRPQLIYVFHASRPESVCGRRFRDICKALAILSILIVLIITVGVILLNTTEIPFRYMLFVRRWPPTVCQHSDQCTPDAHQYQRWLIHGLWPENADNTWDQYCNKEQLNMTELEPLKSSLLNKWPNLLAGKSAESLWEHEWRKHGTCTQMKQFDYFKKSLDLYNQDDLDERLARAGIVPTTQHQYDKLRFLNALVEPSSHDSFERKSYVITCEKYGDAWYIQEVRLCLSFHELDHTVYCTMESSCPEKFYYRGF